MALISKLTAIANAIRDKTGSSGTMTLDEMAENISSIESTNTDLADSIIDGSITSVSNDTVTSIANYAFYYYTNLISASFGAAASIGAYSFGYCAYLTSCSAPKAETLGNYAFRDCTGLTELYFPAVTSIGQNTFYSCTGLSELNFSESFPNLTALEGVASFAYCTGLTKVFIPSTITTIDTTIYSFAPFLNCSSSLVIYTDAEETLEGWGTYWNYRSSSTALTVVYGASEEDYENA